MRSPQGSDRTDVGGRKKQRSDALEDFGSFTLLQPHTCGYVSAAERQAEQHTFLTTLTQRN